MALRLSQAFDTIPELWLNLQKKTMICGMQNAKQPVGSEFDPYLLKYFILNCRKDDYQKNTGA